MRPRTISLVLAAAVLALLAARAAAAAPRSAARAAAHRLNVVFIVSDDERVQGETVMRHVHRLLAEHGVTFSNFHVTTSECGPSRASILLGAYSHHTGVLDNFGPHSYPAFDTRSNLAVWLHRSGYETALVGKYLNDYTLDGGHAVPPGWDDWQVIDSVPEERYYDYTLNQNGRLVHYGNRPADYSTTVLTQKAVAFLRSARKPFFLYFAPGRAPSACDPGPSRPRAARRPAAVQVAGGQRARPRRQALARLPHPGAQPRRGCVHRRGSPAAARVAPRGRPLRRPHRVDARAAKAPRPNGDLLHERQRLPLGRAPARRQALAVRAVDPRAARRPHPVAAGERDGEPAAGPEHRLRLDDQPARRDRPRRRPGRRELRAVPAREADPLAPRLPDRVPRPQRAAHRRAAPVRRDPHASLPVRAVPPRRLAGALRPSPRPVRAAQPRVRSGRVAALVRSLRRRLERLADAPTHHVAV